MSPLIKHLGCQPYRSTLEAMTAFTETRTPETPDQIWLLEHDAVFTLGRAADPAHLLDPGEIPVERVDRGGQVTYHGPGQLVVYTLLDLKRRGLGVKDLVARLERAVLDYLAAEGLRGGLRPGAPGVYVGEAKIAALGLRIRRGCSYHGLSLNVAPDLGVFQRINPCGYPGMAVTSLQALGRITTTEQAAAAFPAFLLSALGDPFL